MILFQNFDMVAGDTKKINITVTDTGSAVDLTGASIKWALKRSVSASSTDVFKTTSSGISITDATHGKFQITLNPSDTLALKGTYYHESEVTDASGNVSTVCSGNVVINPSGV